MLLSAGAHDLNPGLNKMVKVRLQPLGSTGQKTTVETAKPSRLCMAYRWLRIQESLSVFLQPAWSKCGAMTCKSCNTLQPFCLKAIGNTLSHRPSTSRFSTRKWIFLAGGSDGLRWAQMGSDGLRVVCSLVVVWCGPVKGLWPVWGPGELWVRGCQVKVAFRRDKPRCLLWAFYF